MMMTGGCHAWYCARGTVLSCETAGGLKSSFPGFRRLYGRKGTFWTPLCAHFHPVAEAGGNTVPSPCCSGAEGLQCSSLRRYHRHQGDNSEHYFLNTKANPYIPRAPWERCYGIFQTTKQIRQFASRRIGLIASRGWAQHIITRFRG